MAKFEKVEIAGQSLPIRYGFNALAIFEKESGQSVSSISKYGDNVPVRIAIDLVYAGLKDGARVSKNNFILTKDDVGDLLDEDSNALVRVLEVFSKMMGQSKKK
tara:strand:+ start:9343 stop:9654 length:312 start_codon:yes stop_codon:yes gene_type:complete